MLEYPRFVFKNEGLIERAGGTYSQEIVNDEVEHEAAIAAGWYDNLQDAIDATNETPDVPAEAYEPEPIEIDEPPTREEIEAQARAMGIKFDGRIGDRKLMALIEKALEA